MSSIWNTQKSSTESKSVWGSIRPEPQQQVVDALGNVVDAFGNKTVNPNASVFETQHVM